VLWGGGGYFITGRLGNNRREAKYCVSTWNTERQGVRSCLSLFGEMSLRAQRSSLLAGRGLLRAGTPSALVMSLFFSVVGGGA
jgi:hypothetical protein